MTDESCRNAPEALSETWSPSTAFVFLAEVAAPVSVAVATMAPWSVRIAVTDFEPVVETVAVIVTAGREAPAVIFPPV